MQHSLRNENVGPAALLNVNRSLLWACEVSLDPREVETGRCSARGQGRGAKRRSLLAERGRDLGQRHTGQEARTVGRRRRVREAGLAVQRLDLGSLLQGVGGGRRKP